MIIKNELNIFVPDFLNKNFFVQTLEEGLLETNINIQEISFEWGSNPGDNYCSSIYRVLVQYENSTGAAESISLIVKTIPITKETQFLEDVGVFIKEKRTYVDVLPRLEILTNGNKFGAKYYHSMKLPVRTIVFEDLKTDGFRVASRQEGLDWAHSALILEQLAKFHATSMILAKKNPEIVKHFTKGMLGPDTVISSPTFEQMFGGSLKFLISAADTWPGYESITANLKRYSENFKEITAKLGFAKPDDRFTVLNHGDLWTNNFMYAYDDATAPTRPTRTIFVDFQLSFFGSPGCDLNFFLNTSVEFNTLKTKREELIACYYKHFSETLSYLRYENIPTLEDLQHELRSRELYGLFALFGFLPMVTMPKELSSDNSIETMANEDTKRNKFKAVFARKELQDYMKYCLKRMDNLGVFGDF